MHAFDSSKYLRKRHILDPREVKLVEEWLRARGWVTPVTGGRYWSTPEVFRAHRHARDWGPVYADYDLARAAQIQAGRELAARTPQRRAR